MLKKSNIVKYKKIWSTRVTLNIMIQHPKITLFIYYSVAVFFPFLLVYADNILSAGSFGISKKSNDKKKVFLSYTMYKDKKSTYIGLARK